MNRERSWHKIAPPPRHRHRTKGKSCSLLGSSCHFSIVMSRPKQSPRNIGSADISRQYVAQFVPFGRCFTVVRICFYGNGSVRGALLAGGLAGRWGAPKTVAV